MNQHISRVVNHPMTPPVLVGVLSGAVAFGVGFFVGRNVSMVGPIGFTGPPGEPGVCVCDTEDKPVTNPNQLEIDYLDPEEQKAVRATEEENFIGHDEGLDWDDVPSAVLSPSSEPDDEEAFVIEEEVTVEEEVTQTIVEDPLDALEPDTIDRNVFANSGEDDGWDLEEQIKLRAALDTDQPYPIHRDEFQSNESGYNQNECVYYAGDDIMTDAFNVPIYNYHDVVGELKFGFGSGDPKVVYIRNDDLGSEYEILKHMGMYSTEVLGLEIEDNLRVKDLRHSKQPRKMRSEE
jgi:hypothetical protein